MVVKALEQTMAIISPKNAFLGRKQVNLIAEKRPRTLEAFLSMSLHGLSKHMRTTHGPAIIETLRQVILLVLPHGMVHVLHIYACICMHPACTADFLSFIPQRSHCVAQYVLVDELCTVRASLLRCRCMSQWQLSAVLQDVCLMLGFVRPICSSLC